MGLTQFSSNLEEFLDVHFEMKLFFLLKLDSLTVQSLVSVDEFVQSADLSIFDSLFPIVEFVQRVDLSVLYFFISVV
jgi:hypothetical protein